MNEGICSILLDELFEAHGCFENIIGEMKERGIEYPYDKVIRIEENSYNISFNAINRMIESFEKQNYLMIENKKFFLEERKLIIKYIMLYIVSIIIIKVFSKTLSSERLNEIWYALIGMALGSVNATIVNKAINNHRYGKKENRELMGNINDYTEIYDENFEIANREVNYILSLNRNLQQEIPSQKILLKK